jgi:hypothetical membrane protein
MGGVQNPYVFMLFVGLIIVAVLYIMFRIVKSIDKDD